MKVLIVSLLVLSLQISLPPASAAKQGLGENFSWPGPDGKPLPFDTEDELAEFLRTAPIVSAETIPQGINRPLKLVLERDGVRVRGAFRTVDIEKDRWRDSEGTFFHTFRDSYIFEVAAYELSRLLGIHRVPPAVPRRYRGYDGSVQVWVENATLEATRIAKSIRPPDIVRWSQQMTVQRLFDTLIYNHDRNEGNVLIDEDWNVWLIDHTRSFLAKEELRDPDQIIRCDRELWHNLQTLDRELVQDRLKPYVRPLERKALFARWDQLVALLEKRIDQYGEDAVLFDSR